MSALASILVPCHNAEAHLAQCLESALAQTHPSIEVVAIDDGSTDGTWGILEGFAARDGRVRIARQENAGASAARNHAMRLAHGDVLQFLDADDLLAPGKIAAQAKALERQPAAVANGRWTRFYGDPSAADAREQPSFRGGAPVDFLCMLVEKRTMVQPNAWLVPRAVAEKAGPWDESLSLDDDGEHFARVVLAAEAVVFVPDAECYYRSGVEGSLSGRRSRKALESAFRASSLWCRHLLAAEDSPRTRQACADKMQRFVYEYYPDAPDLLARAEALVRGHGGSSVEPHVGGRGFKALSRVVGWKKAKRAKDAFYRMGYGKAGLRRKAERLRRRAEQHGG